MRMSLRIVQQFPKEPGEWNPIVVGENIHPTGVMLACPRCGARHHLGPAPHPSGHDIEWQENYTKISIKGVITCGITKDGKLCQNKFTVTRSVADDSVSE